MPRPAKFDRQAVLEKSIQVFWRYGYASTSIQRLGGQLAMHPGSLYAAFKNKRQLFIEALEYYFERSSRQLSQQLQSGDGPLDGIRQVFRQLIEQTLSEGTVKGCLMINTATELAEEHRDETIRLRLEQMFQSHEQQFRQALLQAQACGELAADRDPAALARLLLVGVRGLRVYGQVSPSRPELESVVDNLLSILSR